MIDLHSLRVDCIYLLLWWFPQLAFHLQLTGYFIAYLPFNIHMQIQFIRPNCKTKSESNGPPIVRLITVSFASVDQLITILLHHLRDFLADPQTRFKDNK